MFKETFPRQRLLVVCGAVAILCGDPFVVSAAEFTSDQPDQSVGLQEIVVTAEKRSERLEDAPVSMSVVSADSMLQNNELNLQDYYTSVPGLSISDQGAGGRVIVAVRGLSSGGLLNPTVGITIDDVPVGSSVTTDINGTQYIPQLDPEDLQRVEVLKGPQGTLYGASSLGGVIRFVTLAPDLTSTGGRVEVDGNTIPGAGSGYGVRAGVNVPVIADTLAIRVSAFVREDPGYVDDPTHGQNNVNTSNVEGVRFDSLWQATQALSLRVQVLAEDRRGYDGTVDTNYLDQPLTPGKLTQDRLPGFTSYAYNNQMYIATLAFRADYFDITSISSYSRTVDDESQSNYQPAFSPSAEQLFGVGGSGIFYPIDTSKATQEIRLTSSTSSKFQWLVGAFGTAESNPVNNYTAEANNLQTGAPVGVLLAGLESSAYHEVAAYADLKYQFTDRFDVQVGGRESHNWQRYNQILAGPLVGPTYAFATRTDDSSFTYLVTPEFRVSDSLMTYARIASGYEPGGPNTPSSPTAAATIPLSYKPSTTTNYELGVKSRLFDRRLSIDADIYYIDWSKIQLTAYGPAFIPYIFNGGKAKSEGAELQVDAKPLETLTLSAAFAYTDAILTNNVGQGFTGTSGDPLPYSSKYTANLTAEKTFKLSRSVDGFVGGTAAYVGKRYENFPPSVGAPTPFVPSYSRVDARTGIVWDGYTVTGYVKNVTNERGVLSSLPENLVYTNSGTWATAFIAPRTVGISVLKRF
jgi:iron complex outermembrane receptor protein